jgi:hypothetical protein
MRTVKKELAVFECLNISSFMKDIRENSDKKNKLDGMSVRALWNIKKTMQNIDAVSNRFNEMKEQLETEVRNKYSTDEYSTEEIVPVKDSSGNDVEQKVRKIKDEYLSEYRKAIDEVNQKLRELLVDKEEVDVAWIDLDSEVENLHNLTLDDLDILSVFEKEETVEDAE